MRNKFILHSSFTALKSYVILSPNAKLIMCYEFVHYCDGHLIEKINSLSAPGKYFLLCLLLLNHLYVTDTYSIKKITVFLRQLDIHLHRLIDVEMMEIIEAYETKNFLVLLAA